MSIGSQAAAVAPWVPGRVTVVVPSFNHARFLRECIDSVLAQDHLDTELIVVDDGSSDGSLDLLGTYGSRLRLIQQQGGRQARARNLALAVATGEFVAFLDSDDRYRPGRLSTAVRVLRDDPAVGVAWSDFRFIDAEGRATGEIRWADPGGDFRRVLVAGNPICNGTVTARRCVLDEIGGFDERVPRVCDGAAWYQIAARGHRFVHLPQSLLDYRVHGANDSARFAAMTRDRDLALASAAEAYLSRGVLVGPADLAWLRGVLVRQFSFRAAARVQRWLQPQGLGALRARLYEALGSDLGLRCFALLHAAKGWV